MPKVSTKGTSKPKQVAILLPTISQEFLAEYANLYNEVYNPELRKKQKKVEKMCLSILATSTGLSEDDIKTQSPEQLQALVAVRLGKDFLVEPGEYDYQIESTSDRQCTKWKEAFIEKLGEAAAKLEMAKAPHSYGYDVVVDAV